MFLGCVLLLLHGLQVERNRWTELNWIRANRPSTRTVTQRVRPYVWYLVATACDVQQPITLKYKATFLNSDGSHFSFHETPYQMLYVVLSVFCFAALGSVMFVFSAKTSKATLTHHSALQLMKIGRAHV